MKIITKKSVILAALAVVLLATALVISCNTPLDGNSDKDEPSKPGTGKVRLTINNKRYNATIVPTSLPSGTKYLLVLDGGGGGNTNGDGGSELQNFYATVAAGSTVTVYNVPIGVYDSAQVFVYVKTASDFDPATDSIATLAIGESTVNDNSGSGWTVGATGTPSLGTHAPALYLPGSSKAGTGAGTTGNLTFNITDASVGTSRISSVSFIIKERSGTAYTGPGSSSATSGNGTPVTFGTSGNVNNIPNGYYNVIYTLKDNTPGTPKNAYFFEILHVYKSMTSVLSRALDDTVFPVPPASPGNNNGTTVITTPVYNNITLSGDISTTSASGVTFATSAQGWTVTIKKGTVNANITVTISGIDTTLITVPGNPTGAIPATSLVLSEWSLSTSSGPDALISNADGLAYTYTNGVLTITINDTNASFSNTKLDVGDINNTVPIITYGGKDWTDFGISIGFEN